MRSYAIWKRARRILRHVLQKHRALERRGVAAPAAAIMSASGYVEPPADSFERARRPSILAAALDPASVAGAGAIPGAGAILGANVIATVAPAIMAPAAADAGAGRSSSSSGGKMVEELMQAVDMIGGLMMQTKRSVDERHDQLAAEMAVLGDAARASHEAVLALAGQMEQMQQAMRGIAKGAPRSPPVDVLRLQVAQSRAEFRAVTPERVKATAAVTAARREQGELTARAGQDDLSQIC